MKIKKLVLTGILLSLSMTVMAMEPAEVRKNVQEVLPNTDIGEIIQTPIPGIYYVLDMSGNVMHVDIERKLIIFGEIYTPMGKGLTAEIAKEWTSKLLQQQIGKISKEDIKGILSVAIHSNSNKNKRYHLIEFTDPDCPFCKQASSYLKEKNIERHIVFTPLPMHPDAKNKCISFLSSKDAFKAYSEANTMAKPTPKAADGVDAMMRVAQKYGIAGTPTFWVIDTVDNKVVEVITGAKVGELEEWIRKNNNGENAK